MQLLGKIVDITVNIHIIQCVSSIFTIMIYFHLKVNHSFKKPVKQA